MLPPSLDQEVLTLVQNIDIKSEFQKKASSLSRLIQIVFSDNFKAAICSPRYNLLPAIKVILQQETNVECIQGAITILWYLSRNYYAKECICSKELKLLPLIYHMFKFNYDLYPNTHKCLSNCSMSSKTHDYLLSPEFDYLETCKQLFLADSRNVLAVQSYFCVCTDLCEKHEVHFTKANIFEFIAQQLLMSQPNPFRWPNRYNGVQYWYLNFLSSISASSECRKALSSLRCLHNLFGYFMELAKTREIESLKAFIFLCNMTGQLYTLRDNTYENFPDLRSDFNSLNLTAFVTYLIKGIVTTMFFADSNMREYHLTSNEGFAYGILRLRDFTSALYSLSFQSRETRKLIICEKYFFKCIFEIIDKFVENEEECCRLYQITYEYGGGGKDDFQTMQNVLSLFLQISYDYKTRDERISELQFHSYPLQDKLQSILSQNENGRVIPDKIIILTKILLSLF